MNSPGRMELYPGFEPFRTDTLTRLYPALADYDDQLAQAVGRAVRRGHLLAGDAAAVIADPMMRLPRSVGEP